MSHYSDGRIRKNFVIYEHVAIEYIYFNDVAAHKLFDLESHT